MQSFPHTYDVGADVVVLLKTPKTYIQVTTAAQVMYQTVTVTTRIATTASLNSMATAIQGLLLYKYVNTDQYVRLLK